MSLSPNYGTTRKTMDEQICRTKLHHVERYSGYGTIDDDPATTIRLRREGGYQTFYLPERTVLSGHLEGVIGNVTDAYSTSTVEHIVADFLAFRDASGNVTIVLDPATPQTEAIATITPTANTTVQGFDVVVSVVGTPDATVIFCSFTCNMNIAHELSYPQTMKAAATAALSAAD